MLQKNLQKTKTSTYTIVTAVILTLAFTTSVLIAQTSKKTARPQKNNQQKEASKANLPAPGASKDPGVGTIFQYVDQQPKFDGNLSEFLSGQLHYPDSARAHNQQGRCVIKFVVDQQGKIVSPELVRSSGFDLLDDEAMRVVGIMPAWKPGKQKGMPAAVYFTLPVIFKLDN